MLIPSYHTPVMLEPCLTGLNIRKDGIYLDLTFGGGGHSKAILAELGPKGKLFAFDQDLDAIQNARVLEEDKRLSFIRSNFRYLKNWIEYYGIEPDGILADLGVSSHHLDDGTRGFSFRSDAPLDMRMNQKSRLTAAQVVNEYSEEQLTRIFRLYGEAKEPQRVARAIVKARENGALETTGALSEAVGQVLPRDREKKELTKVFQALRIEVNGEMKALSEMLQGAVEVLKPGGRLVVLSYHSLEDRLVKNIIRSGNIEGEVEKDIFGRAETPLRAVGKGVSTPDEEEIARNPRSRSAKLRVAEKVES
ncbi:MAG: 16S rRNA (cytosine(1402)-N(4))-methyltransferase RsmH [Bacteroidaceae bacterium]|nr:16S rRNA (cytosine(1402)-N(4))-methyltransferase RsmH [Bacteroidaceae bacterium]